MNKPCETCTRMENPEECFDQFCAPWRNWFAKAWDAACERIRGVGGEENKNDL